MLAAQHAAIAQAQSGEIFLLWDQPDTSNYPNIFKRTLPATLCTP